MAASIFQSFQEGFTGGRELAKDRRRQIATQMAGQSYANKDYAGAERALLNEGMVDEANAYGALGERSRQRDSHEAIRAAMTANPDAPLQARAAAGRDAALAQGEFDTAFNLDDHIEQMDDRQKKHVAEAAEWSGSQMLGLIERSVPEAQRRDAMLQAIQGTPHDTPEARQRISTQTDWTDKGLQALASNNLSVAERLQTRERATERDYRASRDRVDDTHWQQNFNQQERQLAATRAAKQEEGKLDDDTLRMLAGPVAMGAPLPVGMSRNPNMARQIYQEAARMRSAQGLSPETYTLAQAAYRGNARAISDLAGKRAQISVAERTALSNLQLAQQLSREVPRTAIPLINQALLEGRAHIQGDPKVVAFYNALQTSREEYAKVLSGNTSATGITDASRHEASRLIRPDMTPEQIDAAIQTATIEMSNRMDSFDEVIRGASEALGSGAVDTSGHEEGVDTTPRPGARANGLPDPSRYQPNTVIRVSGVEYQLQNGEWKPRTARPPAAAPRPGSPGVRGSN